MLGLIIMHCVVLSFYEEYIIARHPLVKSSLKNAQIIGFGKSRLFHRSRAAREHYTILKYVEQNREQSVKIIRSKTDKIGGNVLLAIIENENLAVRYEKCNHYFELCFPNRKKDVAICALNDSLTLYAFLHIQMFYLFIVDGEEIWKAYLLFFLMLIIHYAFLPQFIKIRNLIWKKGEPNER